MSEAAITVTEALAELTTIDKRLDKKEDTLRTYLWRDDRFKDPLAKSGGSAKHVAEELQSHGDLQARRLRLRAAIRVSNEQTHITIGSESRTVADWLVWRREIAPRRQLLFSTLRGALDRARAQAQAKGGKATATDHDAGPGDIVVNLDEAQLNRDIETLEEILGQLDGRLSLTNAITKVEV